MFRLRQLISAIIILSVILLGMGTEMSDAQQSLSGVTVERLMQPTVVGIPPAPALVSLGRLILAPNTGTALYVTSGLVFYYVESGILTIRVGGPARLGDRQSDGIAGALEAKESVPVGKTIALGPGEYVLIFPDTPREMRDDGAEPTVMLVTEITPITLAPSGQGIPPLPSGIPDSGVPPSIPDSELPPALPDDLLPPTLPDLLVSGFANTLPSGMTQVALVRVTVEPEAMFSLPVGKGPVAIYVESGTLGVTTASGDVELSRTASSILPTPDPAKREDLPSDPLPPPPVQTARAEMGEGPSLPPPPPSGPEMSPIQVEVPLVSGDSAFLQTGAMAGGRNAGPNMLSILLLVTEAG